MPKQHLCLVAIATLPENPNQWAVVDESQTSLSDAEAGSVRRFNFCPTCGRPMDWVELRKAKRLKGDHPRIKILDAVEGSKPLTVVSVLEEPDGSLLFVGDDFDLSNVEPYVAPHPEDTNESG